MNGFGIYKTGSASDNNEYKIAYYQEISSTTGTITVPTGATILLNQLAGGADAPLSTIDTVPTGEFPRDSSGDQVDVSSFDASGNWVLSGTPSAYPVALVYWLKISGADYSNLTIANIIEETQLPVVGDLDVNGDLTVTGGSAGSGTMEWDGSRLNLDEGITITNTTNAYNYLQFGISSANNFSFMDVGGASNFVPSITSTPSNNYATYLISDGDTDSGTFPLLRISGRINNSTVSNRNLFDVSNVNTPVFSVAVNGIEVNNAQATGVGAIIENSNAANTANIAEFQNSTGTVASITNEGYITAQAATGTSDTVAIWDGTTLKKKELKNQTIFASNPDDRINASATEYLPVVGTSLATTLNRKYIYVPANGVISNFYLGVQGTQDASGSLVITLRKNFVNTGISITVPAGGSATVLSDLVNTVSVSAGDAIDFVVTNNATALGIRIISTSLIFTFD